MAQEGEPKRGLGRPPKNVLGIPDTFENVLKALVQPIQHIGKRRGNA